MLNDTLTNDLKTAMLAKDAQRVSVLRSLKSAITYAEVAAGAASKGALKDEDILVLFAKEAKKRQESADSFNKAGLSERASDELAEKRIIEAYLPAELSEEEISALIEQAVAGLDEVSPKAMGQVIAAVKANAAGGRVDGALVARLAKERLAR